VHVVAHHRIGVDSDREGFSKSSQPILDPGLAMLVAPAGVRVFAAEEGAAHAARDAVVVAGDRGIDDLAARGGHGASVAAAPMPSRRKSACGGVRRDRLWVSEFLSMS
jgi:hypothetical protein